MAGVTLRDEVARDGYAVVRVTNETAQRMVSDPFAFAAELLGETPFLLERQPIRPIEGGRSFASHRGDAPLHTDSQSLRGVPAHAQLLWCKRAADRGGATHLVDAWALAERVRTSDAALFAALIEEPRELRFYFGDVVGPTLSKRGDGLVFTHPPSANDAIGARLQRHVDVAPRIVLRLEPGDVLVADNHRMLHGRDAFEGPRELLRLLVWLRAPLAIYPNAAVAARLPSLTLAPLVDADAKLSAVLAMLRGVPPGVVAAKMGIAERELYAWREMALAAATEKLARGG